MLTRQQLLTELDDQIRAGATGFYIQSAEEARLDDLLAELCAQRNLRPLEWNHAYGWSRFDNKQPLRAEGERAYDLASALEGVLDDGLDGRLVIVRHARLALDGNGVALARLKLLLNRLARHHAARAAVVLVSERFEVPAELEALLMVYGLALPRGREIASLIGARYMVAPELLQRLSIACGGLSQAEITHALSLADTESAGRLDDGTLAVVLKQKEQVIAKGGVLEMVRADVKVEEIGGLRNLKEWLARRSTVMLRLTDAAAFGVQAPRGVLIAGMPGCGKSLTAKVTASLFGLPLLRLDIGSLLGKYVGESEHNMRRALQTAEAISPCVLWIDELEKAFVGMGGANASEVTSRLLGYFLTWMQEKSGAVFTIATANDITALPPELLRKGRFDEIFYVGFPDADERREILGIHLRRRHQDPDALDIDALIENCRGYTGADIENAVNEAMEAAFVADGVLTQQRLEAAIAKTTPLRETMQKKVREYEEAFEKLKLKPASHHDDMSVSEMIRLAEDKNPLRRIEVARNREVPDDLLVKLAPDPDLDVRKAVFEHSRCPESLLAERISKGEGAEPDSEVFALACVHRRAPLDLLERMVRAGSISDAVLFRVLRATSDPQAILRAAGYKAWGRRPLDWQDAAANQRNRDMNALLEALARNVHLTGSLQDFLASLDAPAAIRRVLAVNTSLPVSVQDMLAGDVDGYVRAVLAGARIPESVQYRLTDDTSIAVRKALVGNRWLTAEVQRRLASQANKEVLLALAESDHEEALLTLVEHEDDEVFNAVLAKSTLPETVYLKILDGSLTRKLLLVEKLCMVFPPPDSVLEKLIVDPDRAVRHAVCRQLGGELDATKKCRLLFDGSLDEDARIALTYHFPSEQILWALLNSESASLRARGCHMTETTFVPSDRFFESLPTFSNWRNGLVPTEFLDNHPISNVRLQTALANHPDVEIRKRIARRDIDDSVRALLESDPDDGVKAALAEGPTLSESIDVTLKSIRRMQADMSR